MPKLEPNKINNSKRAKSSSNQVHKQIMKHMIIAINEITKVNESIAFKILSTLEKNLLINLNIK